VRRFLPVILAALCLTVAPAAHPQSRALAAHLLVASNLTLLDVWIEAQRAVGRQNQIGAGFRPYSRRSRTTLEG
jgi:hypothetical protein